MPKSDHFEDTAATVWFDRNKANPFAPIYLDAEGDLGSGFVFKKSDRSLSGGDEWDMLSRAASSIEPGDVTGPFEVDENKRFVYKGVGRGVWTVCWPHHTGPFPLFLSVTPIAVERCYGNITLLATEIV